ncbi:MAG: GNAT family N-acetyltransferase [Chloroflexota bacterium]|nr:GNAT family N-acetyltransferase [Chloroflexota bacterium]
MAGSTFPLATERLILRPFVDGDLDALLSMQGREDVTRYLNWGPMSRDQARELLARIKKLTTIDDKADGVRLAVVLGASSVVIGDVSLWRTSREHNQGEIGFVLHPDHQGQGYGTEAMRELLRIGFDDAGFHRIVGRCDARNGASAGLMHRLGMRLEAHLRENELIKGEWCDELTYAMLAAEWPALAADGPSLSTP